MKIGFDAKRIFHNSRGLGSYGRNLVYGLNKYSSDVQCVLFTPKFNDDLKGKYPNLFEVPNEIVTPNGLWNLFSSIWRRRAITQLVQGMGADIYHGLSHEMPVGIEKWQGKKIVTIHDLQFLIFPEFFPWIDRKVYHSKVKHACKVADTIVAICEQTKKDLIKHLNISESKIVVHYQSCSESFYPENMEDTFKSKHPNPYILHVGAFVPNKNQLNLLKAFSDISSKIPHDLVLIGSESGKKYFKDIEQYIEENGLQQRVHILSNVEFAGLVDYYRGADLFCFPSFYEGFGIPVIEAMFSGAPVLSSKTSSLPEVGGDAAQYFDPNNIAELPEKIAKILQDDVIKNKMIQQGLVQAQKFHLKITTQNLISIYDK